MATNTTVLIVGTAFAVLLLAGMLAVVVYKTRTRQRHVKGETIRDQARRTRATLGIKKRSPTCTP
jgi:hypothetical protein